MGCMRASGEGWLIQAALGSFGAWGRRVAELLGVSSVGCVEGVLPLGADLGCGAVVHRSRGVLRLIEGRKA